MQLMPVGNKDIRNTLNFITLLSLAATNTILKELLLVNCVT
jgi:hypothetical protein